MTIEKLKNELNQISKKAQRLINNETIEAFIFLDVIIADLISKLAKELPSNSGADFKKALISIPSIKNQSPKNRMRQLLEIQEERISLFPDPECADATISIESCVPPCVDTATGKCCPNSLALKRNQENQFEYGYEQIDLTKVKDILFWEAQLYAYDKDGKSIEPVSVRFDIEIKNGIMGTLYNYGNAVIAYYVIARNNGKSYTIQCQ